MTAKMREKKVLGHIATMGQPRVLLVWPVSALFLGSKSWDLFFEEWSHHCHTPNRSLEMNRDGKKLSFGGRTLERAWVNH